MVAPKKLAIAGVVLFVAGILIGFVAFPNLIRGKIKKSIGLKPGSVIRDMWTSFPLPVDFKIYVFNVTNPKEIAEGKKPKLQEVGPFFYDEYRTKHDLVDREEDDSVEYSMKTTWFWNPQKSNGLTGEEELVIPHLMILGMIMATMKENPSAIGVVGKAINSIFHKPESIFVRGKAKDLLFNGLPVDCTVTDFAGSMVCNLLKTEGKDLIPDGEGRYKFSLFGGKNGSLIPDRMRVVRGIKNYKDVGKVLEVGGKPKLDIWPEEHCNVYNGTDSTIFAPLIGPDDEITSFGYELCRSISAKYEHPSKIKGVNTYHYVADLGDSSRNPLEKCYCSDPDHCLGKNLYDMTKCVGAPVVASLPHFYDSEDKYVRMVEGLRPNQEDHEISMDFEPMTATPLFAHKRLQFNMFIYPIPKLKLMKNFPEALLPLFWAEEGVLLPDEYVNKVKMLFKIISIVGFIKWTLIVLGIALCGAAGYLCYKSRESGKLDISKVIPKKQSKENDKEKSWPPSMNISTIHTAAAVPANIDRN